MFIKKSKKKIFYISTFGKNPNSGIFYKQSLIYLKKKYIIEEVYFNFSITNLFRTIIKIIEINKKLTKQDIIHSQYGSGCGLIGLFLNGKKIISIRGSDLLNIGFSKDIQAFLKTLITKFYLRYYEKVIVMSNQLKTKVKKLNYNHKIYKITDPIDSKKFYPMDMNLAKKKLGFFKDVNYIFYPLINNKSKEKNFALVQKIIKLFETHKKYKIIGANNKIKHSDMVYYYNACRCIILTSIYEGWPNVVKEAIYCSTPIISTPVSDLSTISKKNTSLHIVDYLPMSFAKKIIEICKKKNGHKKNKSFIYLKKLIDNMNMKYYLSKMSKVYGN